MGLWTFAEISIGIIVTCLPVSPRFFQFLGPKIYGGFSFRSKSEIRVESNSDVTGPKANVKTPTNFERPFTKSSASGARIDPYSQQAHPKGKYTTLEEIEAKSTKSKLSGEWTLHNECQTEDRHDLESGNQGIRVDRTTQIELITNTTSISSSDLAKLQRERGW